MSKKKGGQTDQKQIKREKAKTCQTKVKTKSK